MDPSKPELRSKQDILWLALVVTANPSLAERAVEEGSRLADSVKHLSPTEKVQWKRQSVLVCALNLIQQELEREAQSFRDVSHRLLDEMPPPDEADARLNQLSIVDIAEALFCLSALLRNVYFLRVLERRRVEECCRLLNLPLGLLRTIEQTAILQFTTVLLNDVLR